MLRAVFADSFLFNLALFLCGQVVAYLYLRTGRRHRGMALMFGGWILADACLVLRVFFAEAAHGGVFNLCLGALQVWSLLEIFCYVHGRWRRRRQSHLERREKDFRRGYLLYLRNQLEQAIPIFQALHRRDPWDLEVTIALATACARAGQERRARTLLRTARSLDVQGGWSDVIRAELARFVAPPKARKPVKLKPKKHAKAARATAEEPKKPADKPAGKPADKPADKSARRPPGKPAKKMKPKS